MVSVASGQGLVISDALVRSPLARLGHARRSARAGRRIFTAAAGDVTPVRLELSGKALQSGDLEMIDLEKAVDAGSE